MRLPWGEVPEVSVMEKASAFSSQPMPFSIGGPACHAPPEHSCNTGTSAGHHPHDPANVAETPLATSIVATPPAAGPR